MKRWMIWIVKGNKPANDDGGLYHYELYHVREKNGEKNGKMCEYSFKNDDITKNESSP